MKRGLCATTLSFAYDPNESEVLHSVSATIHRGRITGIVGPNGSGKSTLLRLLCGLLCPSQGTVLLDDQPLRQLSPRVRARKIAFLPQAVNPAFSLTVFEVVCLGRYPYNGGLGSLSYHDLEVARRCLHDTESASLQDRDFMALSGGERQRVLLASILAQEPELLLLDEPTSALDIHHEVEVFDLLTRLATEGYGIGLVTHDLNMAAQYCDDMLLLGSNHAVQACGPPADVMQESELGQAYGAAVQVGKHPFSQSPFVAVRSRRRPT